MKIALVTDVYGETNNGTCITARRLVEGMKARGHEVTVISPYACDEPGYVTLQKRQFPAFQHYIESNGVSFAQPDEAVLRRGMEGCDVVHFLMPFKVGQTGMRLARDMGIAYTTAFHCQPENITGHIFLLHAGFANRMIYRRFWRTFYKDAHFVHCPSQFIANQLVENGYDLDMRVISNGVAPIFQHKEVARPADAGDTIRVLFVGRYSPEKRHDLLIDAVKQSRYDDRIQLIFAGNGPKKEAIQKRGSTLPHPPIMGLYTPEALCDLINTCDLYVHPSDAEIEAISCIEAFTCGLVPVISDSDKSATNQFALTEHNLFRQGDPHSLSQQIDYWIEHPDEKAAMSARYREYAEQFAIDHCLDQMEKMFEDACRYYSQKGNA